MKHLGISGGGTKIAGLFGACESIITDKGYKPDIISGISAGALLAVPLALGKFDQIRNLVLDFNLNTFFDIPPVKPDGKVRTLNALGKILSRKHYLGRQRNIEKVLCEVVPADEFEAYKNEPSKAVCIVGSVDFYTGKRFYIDLKTVSYNNFLKFVNASASLPVFTPGISMNGPITDFEGETTSFEKVLLFDGGVRDHSPSSKVLSSARYSIKETCTVFSRPEDITEIIDPGKFTPKNLLKVLDQYISITNAEISKNDEFVEKEIIRAKKITDHGTIYLPRIMQGVYDVDKDRLHKLYEVSGKAVDQVWTNG